MEARQSFADAARSDPGTPRYADGYRRGRNEAGGCRQESALAGRRVQDWRRKPVGDTPVQRLKARVKLLVLVKPSRKVISVTERVDCRM